MRTNIEVARLCGFDQNSVNHPGILLWPIQRSFLLWMKLTHVVDRHLTTQMAAQRLGISARQCRRLLSRYREGTASVSFLLHYRNGFFINMALIILI